MHFRNTVAFVLLLASGAVAQDVRIAPYASLQMSEQNGVVALSFTGDGKVLITGDNDGNVACWDVEKKILLSSAKLEDTPLFLAQACVEHSYVAVDATGGVQVIDMLTGAPSTTFHCGGAPLAMALDAGRQYLAIATSDERIALFDLKALMPAGVIDAGEKLEDVLYLGFDRLGQQLVAICRTGKVVSWNPATLRLVREITLAGGELYGSTTVVHAAAANRAGNIFAVGLEEIALPSGGVLGGQDLMRNYLVVAYDWNSGAELKRVKTPCPVDYIALGPGSDHVSITNEDERCISLIDLRKGELGSSIAYEEKILTLGVSEDNRWMAAGADNGAVTLWRLAYQERGTLASSGAPSLSGRIRARQTKEPALKPGVPVKLAILGFEAKGVPEEIADVCVSSMTNALSEVDYVTLVERRQIEKIVNEQRFQLSGLTEEEGVEIGKISKADVVLLGSVGRLGTSMVLSAQLISVTTGKVLRGREVLCEECRDQDIYDAINMLASTIAQ